jgi:hypothetical protein
MKRRSRQCEANRLVDSAALFQALATGGLTARRLGVHWLICGQRSEIH